jgi:iron(III) transport system ATP-binding protein
MPAVKGNDEVFLEVLGVSKAFGRFVALDHVSLQVFKGELICILGPSGCGKTTLLRVIAGLEEQNEGEVFLRGRNISRLPTSKRECGIVFQSYALFPNLTAAENVAYGLKSRGKNKAAPAARVEEMLALVGLGDMGRKYPAQLSGGQQQRVALARALAPSPSMLLLDEPLSALDAKVRAHLRTEIRSLQRRLGITTIMVTHDQEEALTMADRIVLMDQARLVQCATPEETYRVPNSSFAAGFIGAMNFVPGWKVQDPETVRLGNLILRAENHLLERLCGGEVTLAIRPEDIRVLENTPMEQNTLTTRIDQIEFRGSSYRLRLAMELQGVANGIKVLDADIPPGKLERLGVGEKDLLKIHFPPDRLHFFSEPISIPLND